MPEENMLPKEKKDSDPAGAFFFAIGVFVIMVSSVIVALYLFTDWTIEKILDGDSNEYTIKVIKHNDPNEYKFNEEYLQVYSITKNALTFGFNEVEEDSFTWVYPLEESNRDGSLIRTNTNIDGYSVESTSEKDHYGRQLVSIVGDYLVSEGYAEDFFNWDGQTFFAYRNKDKVCKLIKGIGDPVNPGVKVYCGVLPDEAPVPKESYAYLEILNYIKEIFPNYDSPQPTIINWLVEETDEGEGKQLWGQKITADSVRGDEVDLYLKYIGFKPNALNIDYGPQASIIALEQDNVACVVYKQNEYSKDTTKPPHTIEKVKTTVSCGNIW